MDLLPRKSEVMRVLIIEDDRMLARLVERMLVESGYAVDVTRTAEEGRQLALTGPYDAVLLDAAAPRAPSSW